MRLGEIRRDLVNDRRDLSVGDHVGRQANEVRDVDYDYVFGNDFNVDDVDELVIISLYSYYYYYYQKA